MRETLTLRGAFPDLMPADAPLEAWNRVDNLYFDNGDTRRVVGNTPVFGASPGGEALALVFYSNAAGEHYWLHATASGIWIVDAAGFTDISPASGWGPSASSVITLEVFNGAVIINDSVSGPFYWSGDPGDPAAVLPGWPGGWRCMAMRSFRGFLFAIGRLDMGGIQRVSWSDAAEAGTLPGAWEPAADNFAGFVDLLPASSPCIDGFSLRDDFLVFKGESVHAFTFIGGNDVFAVRKRWSDVGIAGVSGWCRGPNERALFFGSDGDIYRTDGLNYASILDGMCQRSYYAESDPDQLRRVRAATLYRIGVSILAFPTQGAARADRALLFNWATGEIGWRDMPAISALASGRYLQAAADNTWNGDAEQWRRDGAPWDFELAAATGDDVIGASVAGFWLMSGTNAATVVLDAYAEKQAIAFGDAQTRKLVSRVWPKFVGDEGDVINIRVGGQETAGGAIEWSDPLDFVIGQGLPIDVLVEGRFMALQLTAQGGAPWRLGTIDVEFKGAGLW